MADRLKAAYQGNLFTVFGEPDVDLRRLKDGRYEIEIRGVDIFNPNTCELTSSSEVEDDVGCWFVDTDYDDGGFRLWDTSKRNGQTRSNISRELAGSAQGQVAQ